MKPEPWIIEQLEEERRRREEEEAQRNSIELPQTAPAEERERTAVTRRVYVLDISPSDDKNVVPV